MSKLNLNLSLKNAYIAKHALRDKIAAKENKFATYRAGHANVNSKENKELEEEKKALRAITEEIDRFKESKHIEDLAEEFQIVRKC